MASTRCAGSCAGSEPDVLLLDEPTNHLDIPTIIWLEQQLQTFSGAIVLITHDRRFLQAIANRIGELDRGLLTLWEGSYRDFLKHRAEQLARRPRRTHCSIKNSLKRKRGSVKASKHEERAMRGVFAASKPCARIERLAEAK